MAHQPRPNNPNNLRGNPGQIIWIIRIIRPGVAVAGLSHKTPPDEKFLVPGRPGRGE